MGHLQRMDSARCTKKIYQANAHKKNPSGEARVGERMM